MDQNFSLLKNNLGFNTPENETSRFSLRTQLFRKKSDGSDLLDWQKELTSRTVANLWTVPEFRKFCRPFADESSNTPALVIDFPSTITSGLNYFGALLGAGDSYYDSSRFATKIKTAGVWFDNYDPSLASTPRVYLVPVGADILRSPTAGVAGAVREFNVVDQKLPVPFPIGDPAALAPGWIPANNSFGGTGFFGDIRQFSQFLAYPDSGQFDPRQVASDTRLIGRSVWNTRWMLIIPGTSFAADPQDGLKRFIQSVTDIKIFFQTYAYSGN
jgi:hypothetical protein